MQTTETRSPRHDSEQLEKWLLESELLSQTELDLVRREQRHSNKDLPTVLEHLGFIDSSTFPRFLANETKHELVNLRETQISQEAIESVPYNIAKQTCAVPIEVNSSEKRLKVAMADPRDLMATDTIERHSGMESEVVVAPAAEIEEAINTYYRKRRSILSAWTS